ncbi:hypothetical protein OKW21_001471 [Catalinimonas alkaloidigena]|uniref:hypothetical protein n=1 Tax=Catalinimonas alkaloidigena TaxID=1075417 RepID=UPI002405C39C|nr:hypothetical protein [Catalinimonas alkaloidigena]MDF9796208.1 hypothetical protein [Catalinimonas alkaloidigena]
MESTEKYKVSFRRSGTRKPSSERFFNTEQEAYDYFKQYTPKKKKDKEEEWGVGESSEIKLDLVKLSENGIETSSQTVDSTHVEQQDAIG